MGWKLAVLSALLPFICYAQQSRQAAKAVYDRVQNSIYLIYTLDSKGQPQSQGTAFQNGPHTLLTNAHVIEGGNPVLSIGPVRLKAKVLKVDPEADVALLGIEDDLTSTPLALRPVAAVPGEMIFAVGNPEGFEKTISQGIVSGIRTFGKKLLIQITASISHGSSGGPILDENGEVIGMTVSMFSEGQNLNFAIPSAALLNFLNASDIEKHDDTTDSILYERVQAIAQQRSTLIYSSDESSEYQKKTTELDRTLKQLIKSSHDQALLVRTACLTKNEDSDLSVAAARSAVQIKEDANSRATLALMLYLKSLYLTISLGKDESRGSVGAAALAQEAEKYGKLAFSTSHSSPSIAAYSVAEALEDDGDKQGSIVWFERAVQGYGSDCKPDVIEDSYRSLERVNRALGNGSKERSAFEALLANGWVTPSDWNNTAIMYASEKDYLKAAGAFENARDYEGGYTLCRAAIERFASATTDIDALLSDGRLCVQKERTATEEQRKTFLIWLPRTHATMGWALEQRGVHQEAINEAREAIALDSNYAYAYFIEATAFLKLDRLGEAIAALKDAIRLSDGKYPEYHFSLGEAYFKQENWTAANAAFEQTLSLEPSNFSAQFNIGLCLQRQGFRPSALRAFQDAAKLARTPDDKADALRLADSLR